MKEENLIYIKLEYEEALKSKRDLLLTEENLLKIARITRQYRIARAEEMNIKLNILRKIHLLKADISKLQQILPKIKIPAILQKQLSHLEEDEIFEEEIETTPIKSKIPKYDDDLERQLREIQDKLSALQ